MKSMLVIVLSLMTALLLLVLALVMVVPAPTKADISLAAVERLITVIYALPELSTSELNSRLHSPDSAQILIFDTRTRAEYEVSHLRGARFLTPETSADAFIKEFGSELRSKQLVFYCSVGKRSSDVLQRVREAAQAQGARSCENLQGGIFRWYNEGLELVDAQGTTDRVHGFNASWRRLVKQRGGKQ